MRARCRGNIDETGWTLLEQAALKSAKAKRYRIFAHNLLKRRPAL